MKSNFIFMCNLLLGVAIAYSSSAFAGGFYNACSKAGTSVICPAGTTCTYLGASCTVGDAGLGIDYGSTYPCNSFGFICGIGAKCNGFAGGSACHCLIAGK